MKNSLCSLVCCLLCCCWYFFFCRVVSYCSLCRSPLSCVGFLCCCCCSLCLFLFFVHSNGRIKHEKQNKENRRDKKTYRRWKLSWIILKTINKTTNIKLYIKKIFLRKGESKTVTFEINSDDLKFYNNGKLMIESGEFEIAISGTSDFEFNKTFKLTLN